MSEYHPYKQEECSTSNSPESTSAETSGSGLTKSLQNSKVSKRIRGEIACAECRRLKIRCDKLVPCSTCIKRGCQTLCPNGTIPPGQGSRFVLAATDHLQRKLVRFEARMHALEDALAIAHITYNLEPNPLLSHRDEDDNADAQALKPIPEQSEKEISTVLSDGSGSLHVSESGINRFFGPSGAPESLLLDTDPQEERLRPTAPPRLLELDDSYLPPEIIKFTRAFPLTPLDIPISSTQKSIESFLPPMERAIALCDTFLEHLSWMFQIVTRQLLVSELIPAIYEGRNDYGPHDLALLFIVLAQHFYHLSRAALVLQPVLTECSIVTIKVLHLMSIHNGLSGQESNLEQSYALLNLAGQIATKIGFHIDPASWKFYGREAYDRRVYFWNLLTAILWTSLVTGRPPGIYTEFIDCKIPTEQEEVTYQQGEFPIGFGVWGFQAALNCLLPVVETTLAAKSPSYESVLELDAKIRQAVSPPDSDPLDERTAISMRTFVRSHYQQLMLLYLHRGFFTQAMTEYPTNPLLSPYRKSVITAYQSACAVLDDTRTQFQKKPVLCARVWRIWSFAFAAAVIVGTVATRGIHLNLEPRALEQFESAYEVFRSAAKISNRAARALPVLQAMLQRAIETQKSQHSQFMVDMTKEEFSPDQLQTGYPVQSSPQIPNDPYRSFAQSKHIQSLPKPSTDFLPKHDFTASLLDPYNYAAGVQDMTDRRPSSATPSLPYPSHRRDLSQSWGGLFHEVPMDPTQYAHGYGYKTGTSSDAPYEEDTMIHDRWSSFMNYNVLDERANNPPLSSRGPAHQFQR
ncbi:hypothetical protein GYMLUDRAFT_214882 [Collybiopsis luxurians FD-317 M1]|nr:hypothetical protein GYMLUDRAFT_214882 [Collybiopsis luxurians FD-317 M1]